MSKLLVALIATFAITCMGMSFPVQAMEKAEADERTNPLAMEKAEADERTNPLMMEKAEADERTNPLAMEKCCIDERNNPLSQQSIARTPGTAMLKPGQRLPVQNGGILTMQGNQILLVNRNGSRQMFPPGATISKQLNGQIGIWGTDGAAIWGTGGTTINSPVQGRKPL